MSELVEKQAVLRAINELSYVGYLSEDDIHDAVEWLPVFGNSKYINVERLLYAIRALPDTPNGYSDTYDKAAIIAIVEDIVDTETKDEDAITIRPECHDCGEINRAHYYYEMAINSLSEAERQRDKAVHDRDLWEGYYMRAKLHPFKFLISRIFNRPWLPFEPTMKRKFSRKDRE